MTDFKTFKEYYQDPEFRQKLKEYQSTKVKCECGTLTARNNMSHHRKTDKHQKWVKEFGDPRQIEIDNLKKRLTSLENKFEALFNYKFENNQQPMEEDELEEIEI